MGLYQTMVRGNDVILELILLLGSVGVLLRARRNGPAATAVALLGMGLLGFVTLFWLLVSFGAVPSGLRFPHESARYVWTVIDVLSTLGTAAIIGALLLTRGAKPGDPR